MDRRRLWHRLREPVSGLATLDTVLLLAYATGCAEPRFFEQPCLPRPLMQVIRRVRLAARLRAPFLRGVAAPDRGICAGAFDAEVTRRRAVARACRAAEARPPRMPGGARDTDHDLGSGAGPEGGEVDVWTGARVDLPGSSWVGLSVPGARCPRLDPSRSRSLRAGVRDGNAARPSRVTGPERKRHPFP